MSTLKDSFSSTTEFRRLGRIANRVQESGQPDAEPLSVYLGRGVVKRAEQDDNHNVLGEDLEKYQVVRPGDLVFNRLRTWQGGFGASVHDGIVSPAYIVARPTDADARYLNYVLQSRPYLTELTRLSKWMPPSQFDILWGDLRSVEIPWRAIEEQQRIADFLDDRVARLDRIISARQRQVALLDEERVTAADGVFDPADWAGSARMGRIIRSVEQGWSPQCEAVPAEEGEWGVLKVSAVRPGAFFEGENKRLPETEEPQVAYEVRPGDLLVTRANTPSLVGAFTVVPRDVRPRLILSDKIMRLTIEDNIVPEFVAVVGQTRRSRDAMTQAGTGTSPSMVNIRGDDIRSLALPVLTVREQRERVRRWSAHVSSIDTPRRRLLESIDLLTVYKQSLITAAVTGELDVTTAGRGIPG